MCSYTEESFSSNFIYLMNNEKAVHKQYQPFGFKALYES
jgi:hypothetical protein